MKKWEKELDEKVQTLREALHMSQLAINHERPMLAGQILSLALETIRPMLPKDTDGSGRS